MERQIQQFGLDSEETTVAFVKALLNRVNDLQIEHYNGGNHIPFKLKIQNQCPKGAFVFHSAGVGLRKFTVLCYVRVSCLGGSSAGTWKALGV